jgi:hypothetical protein
MTLEELFAELRDWPSDQRMSWSMASWLASLGTVSERPVTVPVPPPWFGRAVTDCVRWLAQHWPQHSAFTGVRTVERLGLVMLDHDDDYVLAMVCALGARHDGEVRISALRSDPELRETLWRVFEVEGGGEVSLTNVDKYSGPGAGWDETFRVLVADGTLPRDRVLAECLRALGRDFSAYRVAWFARLYASLAPTTDEIAGAQRALRGLLRSPIPATVAFAMRYLTTVDKAGRLDDEEFLAHCPPALAIPAKTTPIAAVDLAARVAARRPDLAPAAAEAVGHGLEHPHRDVQSRALAVLRRLDAPSIVLPRLDLLEPSVRRDAAEWVGAPPPEAFTPSIVEPTVSTVERSVAERAAALVAGDTDPWQLELLLAELAAGPVDLATLRKPAKKVVANPRHWQALQRNVAVLVLAAAGDRGGELDVLGHLLAARLAEVLDILTGKRAPGALLATPTDPAGWLDPRVFVARLTALPEPPPHHDLVAALLRLSADGRAEALAAAGSVPGSAGDVARYALGGPASDPSAGSAALWVAAARARAPLDDDQVLIQAGLDSAGQGRAATYELRLDPETHRYEARGRFHTVTWWRPSLLVHPAGAVEYADQPTVVGAREPMVGASDFGAAWLPWAAQIWPHDAEPFFARTIDELVDASSTYPEVTYSTSAILDALLTHPGRLGPMAAAALALGLSAHQVEHRTRAVDAFATLVPAGRLPPTLLADAMVNVSGHCTATRWAAALRDAAGAGEPAARSVVEVLALLLPRLPHAHPGLHALLSALREESLRLGTLDPSPELRSWLSDFRGGSQGAKSAKALLAELGSAR